MRLARDAVPGGGLVLGIISDERITSLEATIPDLAGDMRTLVARWPEPKFLVAKATAAEGGNITPPASVTLIAPRERPGTIFAIGLNYGDHIADFSARSQD